MLSFLILITTILFVFATLFSFILFQKTNPGLRLWWLRTPTSHALLYGTIAFILLLFAVPQSNFRQWFFQFAGILLVITGFGFIFGSFFIFSWMREMLAKRKDLAILVFLIHIGGGVAGVYLFREGYSQSSAILFPLIVAFCYIIPVVIGFIRR